MPVSNFSPSYNTKKNRLDYFDNYPENQFVDAKLNVCENHSDTMECSFSGASIIPKDLSGEIDGNDDDKEDIYVDEDDDDDMHGVQPYYKMTPLLQRRDLIDREFRWLIPLGVKYLQELWEDESTDSSIIEAILDHALIVSEMDSLRSSINIQSTDSSYVDIPEDHEDIIESHTSSTKTITDDCYDQSNTCNSNKEYKKLHPMEENIDVSSNSNFYSSPYDLLMTLDVARR